MLDKEPPGCPLDAKPVISTASSLARRAISSSNFTCASETSAAEKFLNETSASRVPLSFPLPKSTDPLSLIRGGNDHPDNNP